MPEPWTFADDVASRVGSMKASVDHWIETKGLPAQRVGRHFKFRLSQIDERVRAGGAGGDDKKESTR